LRANLHDHGSPREAEQHASQHGYRVVAHQYEWVDSEVVWDFTETDNEEEE